MALLDAIRKRLTGMGQPAAPVADAAAEQAAIQQTLAAKSGKATAPQGPAASAVGATTAQGVGQAQQAQVAAANQQAAAELGAAEQTQQERVALARDTLTANTEQQAAARVSAAGEAAATRAANEQIFNTRQAAESAMTVDKVNAAANQALNKLATDYKIDSDDLFEVYRQGNEDLALRNDSAQLEQAAFTAALADKAYIEQLRQIGIQRRLDNELQFRKETQQTIYGDAINNLIAKNGWESLDNADSRAWEEAMATIDAETALAIAESKTKASIAKSVISGLGSLGVAGVQAYDGDDDSDDDEGED